MGKRRGNGDGTIYRHKHKGWCATITAGYDENGRRRRRTIYGSTREEVREKLTRLQSSALDGALTEPHRLTVAKFLDRWLEDSVRSSVRHGTYLNYRRAALIHINPRIGGTNLSKLSPTQVAGLYAALEKGGASAHVRGLVHATLHRAMGQAMRWGLVARNVCEAVDRPKVPKKEIRVLDSKQVEELFAAARTERLGPLYILAVTTGLRQGELLALRWEDIDLQKGHLVVRRTLLENAGKLSFGEPKTGSSRRKVDLPDLAVRALKEHRKRMLVEGHRAAELVFCDTEGKPLRKSNVVRRSFHPTLKRAKLPKIRFHDLRHTAATLLLAQGVHPKVVQERLGHSQIRVTLDTYSHVLPSMQKEAASKLDELLGVKVS